MRAARIALLIASFAGLFDYSTSFFIKTVYSGITGMNEVLLAGRNSFKASADSPLIPSQLPGPADAWAGYESKEITIEAPHAGGLWLKVHFMDSHEKTPPVLSVIAGGAEVDTIIVPKGAGVDAASWETSGSSSVRDILIPASARKGSRELTIRSVSGSWAAIREITVCRAPWKWSLQVCAASLALLATIGVFGAIRRGELKEYAANAALTAGTLIITLAAVEFALRTFFPQPQFIPALASVYDADPVIGYKLRPNVKTSLGFDTNRHGMRDFDHYSIKKPGGVFRILCIGDSFTFSMTRLEDSYPKVMERLLNSDGRRLEALNAGVGGYGPDDEFHYLREIGMEFGPDLVTAGFFVGNDITDSYDHPSSVAVDGALVSVEESRKRSRERISWEVKGRLALNWFHLARFIVNRDYGAVYKAAERRSSNIREKMNASSASCVSDAINRVHLPPSGFEPVIKESWGKAVGWLDAMDKLAAGRNVKLAIAIIPDVMQFATPEVERIRKQFGPRYRWEDQPQEALMEEGRRRGWKIFDAAPAMRARWKGEPLFYCQDTHFNERGNRLFAEVFAEWLVKEGLVPAGGVGQIRKKQFIS
ncbi:MAG: SGNH/GDSL hydrolase family protein [Nitrospinae bacterium]|nr:SGNH/GDSL hydrolase family protein [Nitrospinota bacterium]